MRKTATVAAGGALVLALIGLLMFGTAFARTEQPAENPQQAEQEGCGGGDNAEDFLLAPLAKALGLSEDQLESELAAGKSLREIASAGALDREKLAADLIKVVQDELSFEVQDGYLSPTDADIMLKFVRQLNADQLLGMLDGEMSFDMNDMMDDMDDMMGDDSSGMMQDGGEDCHGGEGAEPVLYY